MLSWRRLTDLHCASRLGQGRAGDARSLIDEFAFTVLILRCLECRFNCDSYVKFMLHLRELRLSKFAQLF